MEAKASVRLVEVIGLLESSISHLQMLDDLNRLDNCHKEMTGIMHDLEKEVEEFYEVVDEVEKCEQK